MGPFELWMEECVAEIKPEDPRSSVVGHDMRPKYPSKYEWDPSSYVWEECVAEIKSEDPKSSVVGHNMRVWSLV